MFRNQIYISAVCFATIYSLSSVGFSQESYQSVARNWQPQAFSGQYSPDRNPGSNVAAPQISAYNSEQAPTEAYSGFTVVQDGVAQDIVTRIGDVPREAFEGGVVQSGVVQGGYAQNDVVQGGYVQSGLVQGGYAQGGVYQGSVYQGGYAQGGFIQGEAPMEHIISPDYGYKGPGDMRTHLWKDHGEDLKANGVSKDQLEAMSMETVQKWHNFFHGTQGRPQE